MAQKGILSRRDVLKLGGATLLGLLFSDLRTGRASAAPIPLQGRVVYTHLVVREAPSFQGRKINSFPRDTLLSVTDQVWGGVEDDYNRLWYRISQNGYVYSGGVQPVQTRLNPTVTDIPAAGMVGQVTIPFADSLWDLNSYPVPGPRLYYATAHWIKGAVVDKRDGSLWYKAYDQLYQAYYYTHPEWVHLLSPDELAPLSPDVPAEEKRIEILLDQQLLLAFEGDTLVHAARTATGQRGFETPVGRFTTFHKRPTAHMVGGADEFSMFDLPAIPWCSYITDTGVALHGTYWHNDFGHTHSHGCVNLSPENAEWIYRWTLPDVPAGELFLYQPNTGTRVEVIANGSPPA
jgi:hypothetical protein